MRRELPGFFSPIVPNGFCGVIWLAMSWFSGVNVGELSVGILYYWLCPALGALETALSILTFIFSSCVDIMVATSRSSVHWNSLCVSFKVLFKCTSNSFALASLFSSSSFLVSTRVLLSSSRHVVAISFDNELFS